MLRNRYWTFKGSKEGRPLSDFGLPENVLVDGAFVWGKNSATYFFQWVFVVNLTEFVKFMAFQILETTITGDLMTRQNQ